MHRCVPLDRPVLVGNLVSGGALLTVGLALVGPVLVLIGATYVVAASVFLAAVYARSILTRGQELVAWVVPWLAAVALWAGVLSLPDDLGPGSPGLMVWLGLVIATPCYLVWQMAALAVRQSMSARALADGPGRPSEVGVGTESPYPPEARRAGGFSRP
jgi:hypothetical protein